MLKLIINYAAPFYLGFSIPFFTEKTILNWEWWAIVLPVIALYALREVYFYAE